MWQAEADIELTLTASPTTAVGQKALALAKRRYSTVANIFWVVTPFLAKNQENLAEDAQKQQILVQNIGCSPCTPAGDPPEAVPTTDVTQSFL